MHQSQRYRIGPAGELPCVLRMVLVLSLIWGLTPSTAQAQRDGRPKLERGRDSGSVPQRAADIYRRLLDSTAWVVVEHEDGETYSVGTGWIYDKQRRLLVTNHHVMEVDGRIPPAKRIQVFFPERKDGELIGDREFYLASATVYEADVLDVDPTVDLAVLELKALPANARAVPLAEHSAAPGQRVHSVGNPSASGAMWAYSQGTVRQLYFNRNGKTEFRAVETQSPINPGDSGGPVVNDEGQLVAVSQAYHVRARLVTITIDVSEVRNFVETAVPLLDPQTAETYALRGQRCFERGMYDRAMHQLTEALRIDPNYADALRTRGWTLLRLGDYATAVADFDRALLANPDDASSLQGRGKAHFAAKDFNQAVEDFTAAIRYQPDDADLYMSRAEAEYSRGDAGRCIADYTQAIRLAPNKALYHNNRGYCHSELKQFNEAIRDYSKAIELDPGNGRYYYNRALAYHQSDRYDESVLDTRSLERVDPEYAKSKLKKFDRRYIRVFNRGEQPMQFWYKFHTRLQRGGWGWLPSAPGEKTWNVVTIQPGESVYLRHKGQYVTADRLRAWAGNGADDWRNSTRVWSEHENSDLKVVPDDGDVWYFMDTFDLSLN